MSYAAPRITTLDSALLLDSPAGWKFANITSVNGDTPTSPTTQCSSSAHTRTQISCNATLQTVTFTGQLGLFVVAPSVIYLPPLSGPKLPYTLSYTAPLNGQFPALKSGPYRFWPASYADKRNSFCVVVADESNVLLKLIDCPGSQAINEVVVDNTLRVIELIGADAIAVNFPWKTAMACFSCSYVCTKDNFLFLAQYLNVTLSDANAAALAKAMPQIDCSLCCRMKGTYTEDSSSGRVKRSPTGIIVGSLLGGIFGAIAGFFIGDPVGAFTAMVAGYAAGGAIGGSIPSSSDKGQYALSALEKQNSLVGYSKFPIGPFNNAGIGENVFDAPFPRYAELPYSGAITKPGSASLPQAYLPRDPRYKALTLTNGVQVTKDIFVIIQTDETVYAAGSLYVDITKKKLLGIDTPTGHYFKSFQGQDQAVNDATFGFLKNLGYDTSSMKNYIDIIGYFQQYQG
uniref:Beta-lactamase (EC) n=1 Tax=Ganoderma boninense TaxID=34458 RepID=A0A5K1K9D3_9APHY|nr:Beta-lactamase (EC [Ganoderma boninense]